jgi:hypothetical protein
MTAKELEISLARDLKTGRDGSPSCPSKPLQIDSGIYHKPLTIHSYSEQKNSLAFESLRESIRTRAIRVTTFQGSEELLKPLLVSRYETMIPELRRAFSQKPQTHKAIFKYLDQNDD